MYSSDGQTPEAPVAGEDEDTSQIDVSRFEMTFREDFNSLDVSPWGWHDPEEKTDPSRWIAHTPWAGDFGDAVFTDPQDGFPFTIVDGVLRIEAKKDETGQWRSGLLSSDGPDEQGYAQKYGYFEARMKFPPGKGVWPAFWLAGKPVDGEGGELDVVEYYGHAPGVYHVVSHVWNLDDMDNSWSENVMLEDMGSLTDDFHTYGVLVDHDMTRYYFDRKLVHETETRKAFRARMIMLVNLALGSGWPIDETPDPSYLWVDYIHAYQRK
ncbi:glycoside hydrolase family 16 protein [Henriciella aquimarina]|uniref:glycoside hydrolase family 16 protein n=1 Tax=Henriciella aquimarina TaxID=545261 RepID=UPI001F41E722|nr:glycoside hydrolase family 16 protein [Henriciella aquimarina]